MKKDLRLHNLQVMCSAAEIAMLERYAAREHLKLSVAVRRAALLAASASEPSLEPEQPEQQAASG